MNVGQLCRVFFNDSTQSANIHLLKFFILLHTFGQSESVKIDVNKLLQKYQIDCLFKQNCLLRGMALLLLQFIFFGSDYFHLIKKFCLFKFIANTTPHSEIHFIFYWFYNFYTRLKPIVSCGNRTPFSMNFSQIFFTN